MSNKQEKELQQLIESEQAETPATAEDVFEDQ